jgi:hypothetical protein
MSSAKAAVSVTAMARKVRLSRARFYQLVRAGAFPPPVYRGRRPVYTEDLQQVCLEVRRRSLGVNGEPVIFNARRRPTSPDREVPLPRPKKQDIAALLEGLNSLGLTTATAAQVQRITDELFPKGTSGLDRGEVLKAVFLHLRRSH